MLKQLMIRPSRRPLSVVIVSFICTTLLLSQLSPVNHGRISLIHTPWVTDTGVQLLMDNPKKSTKTSAAGPWATAAAQSNIHILLPATRSNVNFCKTLLTMTILGYPTPHIVAWGDEDSGRGLLGGGSHYAKITRTLDYINDEERRKKPEFEDELVFMLDSYDIWFQLPVDVLIARYEAIVREENARVAHRMGGAYRREGIHSSVIFGAGKRCSPNEIHTLACYPIPESPLPADLHGGNTDTLMGRNIHSSFRTRYLNSGYIMGPVRDLRPLLERAVKKLDECIDRKGASFDNGSGYSNFCYHGSDQSIFVEMFGEQEFHREVMRRHHRTFFDDWVDYFVRGRPGARPPATQILDAPVTDYLKPSFSHQENDPTYLPDKPYEFGIGLDYWSALGHQTSNAESDHRYIRHDQPLEPQVGKQSMFDCPAVSPMPNDLPKGALELLGGQEPNRWETLPLYSEICVGRVPVMIHHNSIDKSQRERQWDRTWWHGRSRALFEEQRRRGLGMVTHGVPTDNGTVLAWEELCPLDVEPELFRDVEPSQTSVEAASPTGLVGKTDSESSPPPSSIATQSKKKET